MGGYNEKEVDDFLDEMRRGTTGAGSGTTGEGARVIFVDDLPKPPAFTVVGGFLRGYRVEDVDDFLAEVWSSVREGRELPRVENVSFLSARRGGYDELQVDDYLDLLSAALDE